MAGFCDRVLDELTHLTKKEKRAIRAELEGHLADHAAALEDRGLTPEEALAQAEAAMGDPAETAKALAQCYSPFWLWLGRGVNLCIAAALLVCLSCGAGDRILAVGSNLVIRLDPEIFADLDPLEEGWTSRPLDLQAEVHDQVLRVYRLALDPERQEAHVYCCRYPKNPFGYTGSGLEFYFELTNQQGEAGEETGSINFMPGYWGWNYWERIVPIGPGDSFVYYTYDRGGTYIRLEIPLEVTA